MVTDEGIVAPKFQIVYSSAATKPFSDEDLTALLKKSRRRNHFYRISGILLYDSGSFLQLLEGQEDHVRMMYAWIQKDTRHHSSKVLLEQRISRAEYGQWSMAFVNVAGRAKPEGFLDLRQSLTPGDDASRAGKYLRFFRDGLCRQGSCR